MNPNLLNIIEETLQEYSRFPLLRKKLAALKLKQDPYLLAIGKTAWPMAKAGLEVLGERGFRAEGYLLTKYGQSGEALPGIEQLEAGHPTPDEKGLLYSKMILSWLQNLEKERTLIVLISGGSSALFEVSLSGVALQQLISLNSRLLNAGFGITEMNKQRAAISLVKDGKALMNAKCREVHVLGLSDVANNDPRVIGSGSFFDPKSRQISLGSYKYGYSRHKLCTYTIIGDNLGFRKLLATKLQKPLVLDKDYQHAPVTKLADNLAKLASQNFKPSTFLLGGESAVKVSGKGLGGRCTHLALLLAKQIAGLQGVRFTAVASDGNDNLDGVSGARVDGNTWDKLKAAAIDPDASLTNCDSYSALKAIAAIVPGWRTPVNVNDIYLLETGIPKK